MEEEIKEFQVWISQKWWALMIVLNPRIESLLNHKWQAFKRLLYVLFFIILCVIIASRFIEIKKTDWIVGLIGVFGLLNWIFVITWGTTRRYQFDRKLAHSNFKRLAYILLLVITIPCALYLLYLITPPCFHKYSALDRFNDSSISPFLNHGNFHFTKSVISLVGTFFLSGVLVSMLVSFINQEAERWKEGELTYKFRISNYRIVIGGHETAPSLIKQLVEKYKNDKVIVYTSREIPSFRCEVEACLDTEHKKESVIFYRGYRDSKVDLKRLNLEWNNLKAIYILGESRVHGEEETSHDTLNMTCLDIMNDLRGKGKDRIDCYVFFEHQTTSVIFQKFANNEKYHSLNFIPYNFYELQAQKAIGWDYLRGTITTRLDRFGGNCINADKHVHLVIIGMSKMGQALGLEAIRVCHYPNYAQAQMRYEYGNAEAKKSMERRRTIITFIDCNMKEILDSFKCRYERLLDEISWKYINGAKTEDHPLKSNEKKVIPDIELEFVNGRIQSEEVITHLKKISADNSAVLTISSCLSKSNLSIASILYLPKDVLEKAEIMIYQPDSRKLVESIVVKENSDNVRAFGEISQSVNLDHIVALETMAKRVNNVYVKKQVLGIKKKDSEIEKMSLSEFSEEGMSSFEEKNGELCKKAWIVKEKCAIKGWSMTESRRWANRYHASAIWQKYPYIVKKMSNMEDIVTIGISNDDDCLKIPCEGLMARTEHNRWCIEQWLLDRNVKDPKVFYSYKSLAEMDDELSHFPTNDQIMTMAIPYIVHNVMESDTLNVN